MCVVAAAAFAYANVPASLAMRHLSGKRLTAARTSSARASRSPASEALARFTARRPRALLVGAARIGSAITVARAPVSGAQKVRYIYRWFRCDWTGSSCIRILGEKSRTYRPVSNDMGMTLRAHVMWRIRGRGNVVITRPSAIVTGLGDPVIAAAGDIACDPSFPSFNGGNGKGARCHEKAVSDLLLGQPLAAVLPLGDNQYECGRLGAYAASYGPSWGRLKPITHPVIGNHEYGSECHLDNAIPYFEYFGAAAGKAMRGWYSYDIGRWHLIALNSECSYGKGKNAVGGCDSGSPEERWLKTDLARHENFCTLAYWHEPRFSSGQHGDAESMAVIWNDLVAAHADVVLSGHDHDYERFDPIGTTPPAAPRPVSQTGRPNYQDPVLDPQGIREFIVGTGGKSHYGFHHGKLAGEVVRNATTYGILMLTLHQRSYDWKFVPQAGRSFTDAGSGACH